MSYLLIKFKVRPKHIYAFLIVISISISCLYLLRQIVDPDFFWHLKTGEWIWQNKALPANDPFSYTTSIVLDEREAFILTSYWLSQLTYYFAYVAAGFPGIVVLRFFIITAFFFIFFKQQQDDKVIHFSLILIFLISLLDQYPIERPQIFSFLFFAMLLFFLEKVKNSDEISYLVPIVGIPLLLLVWSNFHGGYLIGQLTLCLYIVTEGIKYIHPYLRPLSNKMFRKLLLGSLLGIVFSFVNPNTYHAISILLNTPAEIIMDNIEYSSSVKFLLSYKDYSVILNWFFMVLTLSGIIITLKKPDLSHIILLSGLGYFSFIQIRYMPFFLIAAVFSTSRNLSYSSHRRFWKYLCLISALCAALFFSVNEFSKREHIVNGEFINSNFYPVEAVDFIIKNNLKGNVYNSINWGGYLIWRLAPEQKVFIDGRDMNKDAYLKSIAINDAYAGIWKFMLEKYNVNYIILPYLRLDGSFLPIVNVLLKDSDWKLIFNKSNSLIFIRNIPSNDSIIKNISG